MERALSRLTKHAGLSYRACARTHTHLPLCSTTRLPVLEGRNQPALKIDMRRETSRAAAEGEDAGRGGKMATASVAQCFPDWARGHT